MITDEVPDNTVNGAAIINRPTPATNAITMFGVIADEVPGNTVNGTTIINCSANYRSVIGYKLPVISPMVPLLNIAPPFPAVFPIKFPVISPIVLLL